MNLRGRIARLERLELARQYVSPVPPPAPEEPPWSVYEQFVQLALEGGPLPADPHPVLLQLLPYAEAFRVVAMSSPDHDGPEPPDYDAHLAP